MLSWQRYILQCYTCTYHPFGATRLYLTINYRGKLECQNEVKMSKDALAAEQLKIALENW